MLTSNRRSIWPVVAAILVALLMQACDGKFEYDLKSEAPSSQPADVESTDGSWAAALSELILPLIDKHDTEYAPGYSEEVFRSLDLGTDSATVEELLGPPLLTKEFPEDKTYWYYSRHGERFDSYFVRILVFDGEGKLVARHSSFYVD